MSEAADNFNDRNPDEQFFGVSYPVQKPGRETEQLELEVVSEEDVQAEETPKDETPPKEEPPLGKPKDEDDDSIDAELSERARKRIDKLTGKMRQAERERDEAFHAAQSIHQQYTQTQELLSRGERALAEQIKERTQLALDRAKADYKSAYEEGDSDKIIEAQEQMLRAQTEMNSVDQYLSRQPARAPEQSAPQQQAPQQQPQQGQPPRQPAQPEPRAAAWAEANPWFGDPQHPDMTALAYGIHDKFKRQGQVGTDEYYEAIDQTVRRAFPDYFGAEEVKVPDEKPGGEPMPAQQTRRQSPTTPAVAPAGRSGGSRAERVTLTSSQRSLAKRLGITPEQYAAQVLKEQRG